MRWLSTSPRVAATFRSTAPSPSSIATPADYHLYTAANAEGSLAAFRPSSEIFNDGFESGDTSS